MSLLVAFIGYILAAIVNIFDKFILSEKKVSPAVFVFYTTIFLLPVLLLVPFGVAFPVSILDWLVALASGVFFGLGLWTMYRAILHSEISHVGPLIGGVVPIAVLFFSNLFLGEYLTNRQLLAISFLIIGTLIVAAEQSKTHHGWHKGIWWGVASGLFFALSHVASKYSYDVYGFYSGLIWTRGALGLVGLFLLFFPTVRQEIFSRKKSAIHESRINNLFVVLSSRILGVTSVLFIQYAISLGSVSVVNALSGVQYACLIILVFLLSRFRPKIFKEFYTRGEIVQEASAIIFIAIGLGLIL